MVIKFTREQFYEAFRKMKEEQDAIIRKAKKMEKKNGERV